MLRTMLIKDFPLREMLSHTILRGQPWYEVVVRIPERARKPSWPHWMFHAKGMAPWEGAQVTALEVLNNIVVK